MNKEEEFIIEQQNARKFYTHTFHADIIFFMSPYTFEGMSEIVRNI